VILGDAHISPHSLSCNVLNCTFPPNSTVQTRFCALQTHFQCTFSLIICSLFNDAFSVT
jgi:hypothetical protein